MDETVELRKLGQLVEEKQGGEEVSAQAEDLDARLRNARRTDKLKDVLDVERELADTREEIERMEAQKRSLGNRIHFASIELNLREEYRPAASLAPPTASLRLRNALVDGYRGALENGLAALVFVLRQGPSILMWALLLILPVWWIRRKIRTAQPTPLAATV